MLHRLLQPQFRQFGLDEETPPSKEAWPALVDEIGRAYQAIERERDLAEDSAKLASREVQELNAKLSRERDKFTSVFRAAPIALAIVDREGRILDVNDAHEDVFGFSSREEVGRLFWELITPEKTALAQGLFADLISGAASTGQHHVPVIAKDGHVMLANVGLTAVQDHERRTDFVLASVVDVTAQNQLEIELRHSQKLESIGQLAAGIAHEINTPIQFVGDNVNFLSGAFAQLLALCDSYRTVCAKAAAAPLSAADIEGLKREEELADLEYLRTNVVTSIASTLDGVGRVARIVKSMKAFAHPDRGERATADLNAALRDTLTVATNELKYVATVETDFGRIPAVPCFVGDLNQVFLNLLVNAAHAIGDVVGKTGQRGVIRVRTYLEGSVVVIAISDTGTGIPEAVRGRIFDPFFTTKEVGKGTGQGLALARAVVVDQHGGSLTFETEMGKGTTFLVQLPFDLSEVGDDAFEASAR
ncbi:MAG: ATP-binding protein [Polyangia bacterium]